MALDNLSAHKVAGVKKMMKPAGASGMYLPPYCPGLSLMERDLSKLNMTHIVS